MESGRATPQEVRLNGVSAAATGNVAGQVQAALQVFAAKQASNAQASAAVVLLQSLVPPSAPGPAHLGRHVDTQA